MAKNFLQLSSHPAGTVQYMQPVFAASDATGFSDLIYISGSSITTLFLPGSASGAAWTTADIAIYCCVSNGSHTSAANYGPLYKDDGTQYVIVTPASIPSTGAYIQLPPYDFVGIDALQFRSVNKSDHTAAVTQSNSPTLTVFTIGNGSF